MCTALNERKGDGNPGKSGSDRAQGEQNGQSRRQVVSWDEMNVLVRA